RSWKFGLLAGFYSSLIVLAVNVILILVDCLPKGRQGYRDGLAVLAQVNRDDMSKISVRYRVLINVCSTILLTSSNYAMQVLCAPTRAEIENAHRQGSWMDIAILSFHNLRRINRKRTVSWIALALSSVPLHLLYNAAIVQMTYGQDFAVNFINGTTAKLMSANNWEKFENKQWSSIYSTMWDGGHGNLTLVVHNASFE
ncbi:hypothetical protein EJ04DRAFT_400163, partial [Polyplosphaeria fusca]